MKKLILSCLVSTLIFASCNQGAKTSEETTATESSVSGTTDENEGIGKMDFQETEYFKERAKERYKIEAKNSELKHRHGYETASSSGLIGMEIQGALTIFAVNLKRIITLIR